MASKKKQKGMVFHQEVAATPAATPAGDHLLACYFVPKSGKASEGGMEQSTCITNEEVDMAGKPIMYPSKEAIRTSGGLPAVKHLTSSNPQSDNLSPDSICKGIRVTLDNNSMWNEFFRSKTEMILTKQGSRMFPYCRFRISGLNACRKYSLVMDIQPLDNSRYKWTGKGWQVSGKAECHLKSQPFAHPESPSTGQHWMQNPVSFYKLKLTNNMSDQEGNTILHPMHRYLPRLHVVQTDKAAKDIKLNGPSVVTFTFHQTEFMAVTAYQNSRFSQLKVDYNPFAKGLKEDGSSSWGLNLKCNSGKDLHKDGGTTTNKQNPVKKNLKSLLTNHKPRSSKTADSKPSVSGDPEKTSTTNKDLSAAKVTEECSCSNSGPPQKLISELIREAHVSLQRCNLEQLGINNSTSRRAEQTNTKTTALKSNGQDVPKRDRISVKPPSKTSPSKKGQTVRKTKVKEDKDFLKSLNCKDSVRTDSSEVRNVAAAPAESQNSSVDSDHQLEPEAPSEVKVKQHKRPLPLPLPALALFLKQHSTKSKKCKSKLDSLPPALPSESVSEPQSSAAASACFVSDHAGSATGPLKNLTGDITKCDNQASRSTGAHLHPDAMVFSVTGQAVETANQPSSPSCPDAIATTYPKGPRTKDFLTSFSESPSPEPAVPDVTPVLSNSDQPFCTLGTSISPISSTLTTSSASPILSPPFDTVLPAPKSPQTLTITESSALPSDYPTMKSDSLLHDPECSSFGFESLSPASSPEPLPSLPTLLALELDSTTSEPANAVPPEELTHSEDSAACVFKWHTVLPPPESYIDTSFTPFQPTPQTLPLASVTPPLMPSQTPCHPEPQTLDTSTSTHPPDPALSFQENEQSLPFPAELSPLALHLPLSPTFSSLDGEGLSPTPSFADLVHFFSTNEDLGMGVEFSNTERVAVPCPPPTTVEANAHEPSQQLQPIQANKLSKRKKSLQQKLAKTDMDQKMDDSTYTSMQPNLEEVEEQLFISFTSKEALKLHTVDSSDGTVSQPQMTPEGHVQQSADTPENAEGSEEKIAAFEKILLRDLKLMRHRQVIHPVLQEVGLKMNLLDPSLAIDLQYLGVRLPIPPPGVSLEPLTQELPPPQGISAAFVSRTGKTTDVTQIKGWREKFTPSEAPPTPAPAKSEAGPSSDLPKKNLSAFCSDMLDEYLENEGKLIDERAASFSQPLVEPVVYELPTRSTSYVRTLDSVLKKQTASSPTSDLISGFIPPSKRPKLTLKGTKTLRRENAKQRGPKHNKPRPDPATAPVSTHELSPADSNLDPKQPSEHPATQPHKSKKHPLFNHTAPSTLSFQPPTFKKRKKLKPKTSSQTLNPLRFTAPSPGASEDMALLESDSELGAAFDHSYETCGKSGRPVMTRAMLRQKDLEDGVVWEGRPRTSITKERAAIALTSLFTLMGFASENPTAPIQLVRRRAPPCLNEFCRLGCVCSSLSHCSRVSHCGRPPCMFGCSCLKQKVVLLKNLDGSDSSPSHHDNNKKRKRKRRMKMAYILKEADSVSQPAERVRTLWKRVGGHSDPDPIHIPELASLSRPTESREDTSSCARVRAYRGKKKKSRKLKQKESSKEEKSKGARLKPLKRRNLTLEDTNIKPSRPAAAGELVQPPSPPAQLITTSESHDPKPSKRLIILAECKWLSDADRSHVLKKLCEAMAWDRLNEPFWIRTYLISPISQTVEESGADSCIQYKIHISRPKLEWEKPAAPVKPLHGEQVEMEQQQQVNLKQVLWEAEPPEDWQREVEKEEVEEEVQPLEDWQREVEEGDIEEEEPGSTDQQVDDGRENLRKEMKIISQKKKEERVTMALPFLTGISPAGFLSANRKQPEGTDQLVQVNGKVYPLAKIQLGKMGALHPANRLAAYLTGRVGSNRTSSSSSSSKPPQNQSSGPTPQAVSSASSVLSGLAANLRPRTQPSVTVLTFSTPPTVLQPAAAKVDQSPASSDQPTGEAPKRAESRVVTVTVYPGPAGRTSQVRVLPAASGSSAPTAESQVSSSVVPPVSPAPKGTQLLMVQVPGPCGGKLLVPGPCAVPPPSTSQRMVLQPFQAASGLQYYRRPDGKLVQLVPISHLRSVNQTGSPSRPVPPATSCETRVITVGNQTPPPTAVMPSTPSTSTSPSPSFSLSSLQSFSVAPLPSPPRPSSGFLAQKGTCTFKILPANSSKEPIIVTCPKVPPHPPKKVASGAGSFAILQPHPPNTPMYLINLKPPTGQGAEIGVKAVAVSAAPAGPGGASVQQKPVSPQINTTTIQTPAETTRSPPAPPGSEVTPAPPSDPPAEPELACDLVDLDVICVKTGHVTTEMKGGAKQSLDMVEPVGSPNSKTDNSSDFGDETESEEDSKFNIHRHIHNVMEKQRRGKMRQLFEGLRREVGLRVEKTSKISTLNKAVKVIKELRSTETDLEKRKMRLMKRRDYFLTTIASATGSTVADVMEVMDLLDEADELTDNSSDEERVVTKTITTTNAEDGVQSVVVETVEESSLNAAQRRLASIMRNVDTKSRLSVKTWATNTNNSSKRLVQVHQEIQTLQSEAERLKSLKVYLNQQRDAYIQKISQRSGESEQRILRKLQHLSSKQRKKQQRHRAANRMPAAAGGGASDTPAGDTSDNDIIITSSYRQQQTSQAPPTHVSAPPTTTPVQHALQAARGVSHNASVVRHRPRTIPNILSRSKNPAPAPSQPTHTVEEAPSFQALVPPDILSLVRAALPGKPVLALNQLMAGPTVLQASPSTGMASVTLNFPSLTNQQIQLTPLPHTPTDKIYSSSAPLTLTNLTATNFNNLLQPVQPVTPTQTQLQQLQRPPQHHRQQQEVLAAQPLPPPLVVSAGSDLSSDQTKHQDRPPSQTDTTPESSSSLAPPSAQGPPASACPDPNAGCRVAMRGPVGAALQQEETREDADHESLTSLLNEIVFLNQQTVTTAMTARLPLPGKLSPEAERREEGTAEHGHAHSPWLLQLDSDSDDIITTETEDMGLNHAEMTQSGPQSGPANGNSKGGVMAPPPLLQMSVGGAKVADTTSTDEVAGEGGGGGGGGGVGRGRGEGGVTWRPMPRLVPLGLRGNPPT